MADSLITICLNNGRSISVFVPNGASIGQNLPCEKLEDANIGSPDSFTTDGIANMTSSGACVPPVITDVFFTDTKGAVELIADGNKTGVIFRAPHCQATQAGRQKFNISLRQNVTYRVKVLGTFTVTS